MMLIVFLIQILLFIEDPILLGGFKLGYKALDLQEWAPNVLELEQMNLKWRI